MKDAIEAQVAGNWLHVERGSFTTIADPTGGKEPWFQFTIGDATHKTARGPVSSLQLVITEPSGEAAAPAPRAARRRTPATAAPAGEAAAPAKPRARRKAAAETPAPGA